MAERLRKILTKHTYRCGACYKESKINEWHTATYKRTGKLQRRLPFGRGINFTCPACGRETSAARMVKVMRQNGVEVDGYYTR